MLGVSQPGNPPSSLRHSASFSCLQRGSGSEAHRVRTSTLPQQPSLQLNTHQYNGMSSLQHRQGALHGQPKGQMVSNESSLGNTDLSYLDNSNDYGFVRSRPRLRSTNAILLRGGSEDQDVMSKSTSGYLTGNDRESVLSDRDIGMASSYRDAGQFHHNALEMEKTRQDCKAPSSLRGALILFTASTSSWWKSRQRDELANSTNSNAPSSDRKWTGSNSGSMNSAALASPTNERRWPCASANSSNSNLVSPIKESKWSVNSNGITPDRRSSNSSDRKWSTPLSSSSSSNNQDRKWRSLGALLRTPVGAANSSANNNANGPSQSRSSQSSVYHNSSMSMIEDCERIPMGDASLVPSAAIDNGYYRRATCSNSHPASTSKLMSKTNGDYSLSSNAGRSKVGRRLFQQPEDVDREMDEDLQMRREAKDECSRVNNRNHHGQDICSTRAARAQSFYLLDDFLRPQPQSNGGSCATNAPGAPNSKSKIDLYLSSPYARSANERTGSSDTGRQPTTTGTTGISANGPRNVTNITPPRRHNSSSDSLEVATSPLPPPVPPPPPQINSTREKMDRDWGENLREKDLCRCRMCWNGLQQKSLHEEVSFFVFVFILIMSGSILYP